MFLKTGGIVPCELAQLLAAHLGVAVDDGEDFEAGDTVTIPCFYKERIKI